MVIVGWEMVIRESRCTTPVIENPTLLVRQPGGIRIVNTPPVMRTRRSAWPLQRSENLSPVQIITGCRLQLRNNCLRGTGVRNRNFAMVA